ncbi:MAG: aldo/keto reductase [Dehalococcoidia bacterium]|jgi:aryl-alcohol dehydrogenase-like predicted oxidoreductase
MMQKRRLGRTDIYITPIGLGTWQLSEGQGFHKYMWAGISAETTNSIIKTALDGGISWFDTAEIYGNGRSEKGLASALKAAGKNNGDVVIATKWWPLMRRASSIRNTIDERLSCLKPFAIDLYQVHNPYSFASIGAQMNAMADLCEAGKIRSIGVSNFSAKMMRKAHDVLARRGVSLASNQVKYNLLARGIEDNGVLDAAKELGITIICYSPLEMGLLSGKFHNDPNLLRSRPRGRRNAIGKKLEASRPLIDVLSKIAEAHGATVSQVALSWLVTFSGDMVVAIPGASKPKHAEESAGAMKVALTCEEMERIDRVARVR